MLRLLLFVWIVLKNTEVAGIETKFWKPIENFDSVLHFLHYDVAIIFLNYFVVVVMQSQSFMKLIVVISI